VCDPGDCSCQFASPIIIDTTGKGFRLTSSESGVDFDILGDGKPARIAWTAPTSGNAFLALGRNHNGRIDNGKELFGNLTDQPPSEHPNGFLALAEFDKLENGGNGDGIIDSKDAVFADLLLWIDENHDGISQPNELHTLPELGVYSISLSYRDDRSYFDGYGNWFHYQSILNPDPQDAESKDGRFIYDVFFMTEISSRGNRSSHSKSQNHFPNLDDAVALQVGPSKPPTRPVSGMGFPAGTPPPPTVPNTSSSKSGQYRFSLNMEDPQAPKVQIWNDSDAEITAVAITIDLSDDLHQVESRTYYDVSVNYGEDLPIYSHQSRIIPVGYVAGKDVTKLSPRVRAVVFSNGTSVGEQVWIDAIMVRRRHLYTSLLTVRGLLAQRTRETLAAEIAQKVQAAKGEMRANIPHNEFRIVDDLVFDSAVKTLRRAKNERSSRTLSSLAEHLDRRIAAVAKSGIKVQDLPEMVPSHLDSIALTSANKKPPSRPRLIDASLRVKPGLKRLFADTFSCVVTNMTDLNSNYCTNPPQNTNPAPGITLQATLTATDSRTGVKSTTVFSTTGTASDMCTWYTDCDGILENDDYNVEEVSGQDQLDGGTEFFWVESHYTVLPSGSCDCEDPDPEGTVWNYSYSENHGTLFWVAGSGNASNQCSSEVKIE
jgi:hypothetical protein